MRNRVPAAAVLFLASCGGGGSSPTSPPAATSPQVSGQYDVAVRLLENDCSAAPTVAPQPTSVAHTSGASDFTLTHGGLRVTGTVSRDGTFTTQPVSVTDALGPAVLTVAGRFTTSGLDATVTVSVTPAAAPSCRYLVGWTGIKRGSPNVLG
jgi:hypothetical protein